MGIVELELGELGDIGHIECLDMCRLYAIANTIRVKYVAKERKGYEIILALSQTARSCTCER